MYVQLVCFLYVLLYAGQEDAVQEHLCDLWLRGDEDAGRGEHGVGCPVLRACDGEEGFPCGDGREYLEGFGKLAGLVAGHYEANL